jgi:HTH-like domain
MCRLLQISKSGFYAWLERPMSTRDRMDLALSAQIHAIHRKSRGAYGAPMIHAELADDHQIHVGCKRVARLMRAAGLQGVMPKRYVRINGTVDALLSTDLVDRQFKAGGPDQLWVADITYIPTWAGFLYLSIVLDVWSRKIVGWSMETHLVTSSCWLPWRLRLLNAGQSMWCITATTAVRVISNGRRNILPLEVLHGTTKGLGYRADRTGTDAVAGSTGRQPAGCHAGVLGTHCGGSCK